MNQILINLAQKQWKSDETSNKLSKEMCAEYD